MPVEGSDAISRPLVEPLAKDVELTVLPFESTTATDTVFDPEPETDALLQLRRNNCAAVPLNV